MQRKIAQQRTTNRRQSKRRHPRATYLGFTAHQWPFLFVLVGSWLFAATLFVVAKLVWHWTPEAWTIYDRLALVIKDAVFALVPSIIAICVVAAQRADPSRWWMVKRYSAVDLNIRFVRNSFEQFTAYFIANLALAVYGRPEEAGTLVILTVLFVLGRVLFWIGYHFNPYLRAFGFGLTFYPTLATYVGVLLFMAFGVRLPL
jgi:uncharacterized MAPEG superfamily protein